jgi:hypothetical protein
MRGVVHGDPMTANSRHLLIFKQTEYSCSSEKQRSAESSKSQATFNRATEISKNEPKENIWSSTLHNSSVWTPPSLSEAPSETVRFELSFGMKLGYLGEDQQQSHTFRRCCIPGTE